MAEGVSRSGEARSVLAYSLVPAVGLITAPVLARVLGVAGRGELAAILQPLTLADAVAAAGFPAAVTYYVGRHHADSSVLRAAYRGVVVSGLVAYACLVTYGLVSRAGPNGVSPWAYAIWLSVLPGAIVAVKRGAWAGRARFGMLDLERGAQAVGRLACVLCLALAGLIVADWYAGGFVLVGLAVSMVLWRRLPGQTPFGGMLTAERGRVERYAMLAAVGTVAASANARVDQAVLPLIADIEQLGLYSVAVTVAEAPLLLSVILGRNIFTAAAKGASLRALASQTLRWAASSGILAICLGVLSGSIVPRVFGRDFVDSVPAVYALLPGVVVAVVVAATASVMLGWGKPLLAAAGPGAAAVTSVAGLLVLGRGINAFEAGIVASVGQLAGGIVGMAVLLRVRKSRAAQ